MDVIDGCAPFVLTMTLEYSPEDTESFLDSNRKMELTIILRGTFRPTLLLQHYARHGNAHSGPLIGAINDNGLILRNNAFPVTASGNNEKSFVVEQDFTLFIWGVNSSDQGDKAHDKLVAVCPDNWEIK